MDYRFKFSRRAVREAEEAFTWLAEHSPERAAKWYTGLFETIETLKTYPRRCPLAPESDAVEEEIRQLFYGKRQGIYRSLFAIRGEEIAILSIRHGARFFEARIAGRVRTERPSIT
jgi:plasmid stabilization system protein ParE